MLQRTVRFVHLTDIHVSPPPAGGTSKDDEPVARLDTALEMIRGIDPAPDFAIVSGDITDKGDEESYRIVRRRLDALAMPVVHALGNHDSRPGFYAGMLDRTQDAQAQYCHERSIAGVHVIVLDTSVPGRTSGEVGEAQFDFLEAALRREPDRPKIVVMHHAPRIDEESPFAWESLSVAETERFRQIVGGGNVAGILTGHIHHDRVSNWHGVSVIVGMGLQAFIDPLYRKGLRILSGASFGLCTLRPSGLTVSFVPLACDRRPLGFLDEDKVRSLK